MDFLVDFLDSTAEGFWRNFSWDVLLHTYWFLVFVEFPRYYLLETGLVLWRKFNYQKYQRRSNVARVLLYSENPLVSMLVPGKNEGKHIFKLVKSLNEQTYRNYELIVVDDGSDDETFTICTDLERAGLITTFVHLGERGGKASAANAGLRYAKGKYIVHLDADTSLDRDAIEKILIPFYYDDKIKAVGGTVKVRNVNDSICTSMQAFEYLKTIQVGRMVTNAFGLLHIISGAFGAFERETLEHIGGWDIGPGLDGDITQKIRKAGFNIFFAEDAIAMTNVPTSWRALFRQRERWSKSLVRFRLRKHLDIFKPTSNFNFSNFISNLDGIAYDFIFNIIWFIYIIILCFEHTDRIVEIFCVGYIIRMFFNLYAFTFIMMVSERWTEEFALLRFVPLSTFYTGYFLRFARLVAHLKEIFFFSSYKDPWNPAKVSEIAQVEKI